MEEGHVVVPRRIPWCTIVARKAAPMGVTTDHGRRSREPAVTVALATSPGT
jgi:hypothetical protein